MSMRIFFLFLLIVIYSIPTITDAKAPNLIIILADDLGYADVGFNGCKDIPTPHIDSIAANGVRCTKGYVSFPVCGPSRAGLLTGRYQGRFGFRTNPTIDPKNEKAGLPFEEKNIAEVLRPVGYKSTLIGKWHMGSHPKQHPLKRGFDEFYGFLSGGHDYFPENLILEDLSEVKRKWQWYRTKLLRNHTRVKTDEYLTDELSNEAVSFVERHKAKPFFLYLSYNAPHTPLQASEKYLKRFDHIKHKNRKIYAAMISAVDDGVGRVLAKVKETGIEEDTLIFFLSDNGGPTHVGNGAIDNGPLQAGKGSLFEGGTRVPFAVQWTGTLPKGVDYSHPVISLDILGTIAALSNAPLSKERPLDGVNIIPHLTGKNQQPPHDALFWNHFHRGSTSILQGNSKLIRDKKGESPQLFDLKKDISEKKPITQNHPEKVELMNTQYQKWHKQLKPQTEPGLDDVWWTGKK